MNLGPNEPPTDIAVEVMGFGQSTDMNYFTLDPTKDLSPYSAKTLISLDKNSLHLEPGQSGEISATIQLPQNVGAGGRYAIIYVHALPGKGQVITTAINVPVLITIAGTTPTESGSIQKVDTGDIIIGQPIVVTTSFKNTGNYHYYHTVNTVTLTDSGGKIISTDSTTPSIFAVIPDSTVNYSVKPSVTDLPIGTYTINSKVLLENGKVLDEKSTTFEIKKPYIPPVTESSITLTPGSSGTLTSPDSRISVTFPQAAVLGDAVVTLKPYSKDKLQAAPAGSKLGTTSFEITGLAGLLSKDATVKVTYSADDLAAAGGDATQLKLSYYDAAQGTWVILPTQVDTQATTLTATTNHLSVWAVMVSSSTTGGASSAGASEGSTSATPLPVSVNLLALIISIAATCASTRKRK
ncbi:MAG: hypothetical protein ABFC24_04865 [Methanoregulaceae archaeon]